VVGVFVCVFCGVCVCLVCVFGCFGGGGGVGGGGHVAAVPDLCRDGTHERVVCVTIRSERKKVMLILTHGEGTHPHR